MSFSSPCASQSNCHEVVSTESRVRDVFDCLCDWRVAFRSAGLPEVVDLDGRKTNVRTGGSGAEPVEESRSVSKRSEPAKIARIPGQVHRRTAQLQRIFKSRGRSRAAIGAE